MSFVDTYLWLLGFYLTLWHTFPVLSLAEATIVPAPLVISPSQYWEGNDGPWSTFTIQAGTPAQNVRVLISTAGSSTWVVLPEGCPADLLADCINLRGDTFEANASSTWEFNDYYDLVLESNLDYDGSGAFGFDKIGIGWQGDGGPVLEHQVVAGIATEDFWFGTFGLSPHPTNFTDFNDPQPSYLQTLKNQSLTPSMSWSYTAGAPYRFDKVLGSLIFGGYDAQKAGVNLTSDFGPDVARDLTVGLQAIAMQTKERSVELLLHAIFTFIDSTVPHIWLPETVCKNFERELGLTWNSTVGLYLLNDTVHDHLLSLNASFTFKVGNTTTAEPTINITLPYAAFDLSVDYPIVSNLTRYFPIVRATNETQYTLGRTFLQEAYLTVDYERSQFYVSQTQFRPSSEQLIVPIPALDLTFTTSKSKKRLPVGAIAGIAIGSIVIIAALVIMIYYLMKRRQPAAQFEEPVPLFPEEKPGGYQKAELDAGDTAKLGHEIGGEAVEFFQPDKEDKSELPESSVASPVASPASTNAATLVDPIYEMTGDRPTLPELAATTRVRNTK